MLDFCGVILLKLLMSLFPKITKAKNSHLACLIGQNSKPPKLLSLKSPKIPVTGFLTISALDDFICLSMSWTKIVQRPGPFSCFQPPETLFLSFKSWVSTFLTGISFHFSETGGFDGLFNIVCKGKVEGPESFFVFCLLSFYWLVAQFSLICAKFARICFDLSSALTCSPPSQ